MRVERGFSRGAESNEVQQPPSRPRPGDVSGAEVHTAPAEPGAQSTLSADVYAVSAAADRAAVKGVPTVADLEALKAGRADRHAVETALRDALLSDDPRVLKKAATTLQVAESYARKAQQDRENYAGTGFKPLAWPGLSVSLSAAQTQQLIQRLAHTRDGKTVDVLALATTRGLLRTEPPGALNSAPSLSALRSDAPARLPGSDGSESPRGAATFQEEWSEQVAPGLKNIRDAIVETAKATGCPYSRGNHAKGIAFEGASFKLDSGAPPWARELLGDSLEGGMIRVSGSQTNPKDPDQAAHMPGIRVVFPVNGTLEDSGTQLIDLTANTGSRTHAQTAAEHTKFTQNISVPREGLAGTRPVRAAKHLLGAMFGPGKVLDRIDQMRNAVEVTDMAMGQRFHEHTFFGRHAFFVGGRYVQVRFEVIEPKSFPDASKDDHPDARLNAVSDTVGKHGMKLAMYVTELPDGRPDLVEKEGWTGLPEKRLATITVPPQQQRPDSSAARWFDDVPHVPGGADKVFHAAGLGRHRVPIYEESGRVRSRR